MRLEHGARFARLVALFLVVTLSVATSFAQSPTFVRTDYPALANDHTFADFNGDGRPDLAGFGAMTVAVMLGNGDGTFLPRVEYPVASWSQAIAAGDFNSDGNVDLMATINDIDIGLALLTGRGDGTFNAAVHLASIPRRSRPPTSTTTADSMSSSAIKSPATRRRASSGGRSR